jgi:hypothetical protein
MKGGRERKIEMEPAKREIMHEIEARDSLMRIQSDEHREYSRIKHDARTFGIKEGATACTGYRKIDPVSVGLALQA